MDIRNFFRNIKKAVLMKLKYEVFNDEFICIRLTREEKNIVRKLANCHKDVYKRQNIHSRRSNKLIL